MSKNAALMLFGDDEPVWQAALGLDTGRALRMELFGPERDPAELRSFIRRAILTWHPRTVALILPVVTAELPEGTLPADHAGAVAELPGAFRAIQVTVIGPTRHELVQARRESPDQWQAMNVDNDAYAETIRRALVPQG